MKSPTLSVLTLVSTITLLAGCDRNPIDPSQRRDGQEALQRAAKSSSEFYSAVASAQDASTLMRGTGAIIAAPELDLKNQSSGYVQAKRAVQRVLVELASHPERLSNLDGVNGDSLLWQFTKRNQFAGFTETVRLLYDFDTGIAKMQAIKFNFDDRHWVRYDSSYVEADLNKTLEDESDDLIKIVENLKQYKEGHQLQEEWSKFVPDAYPPGSEPDGGIFDKKVNYHESSFIRQTSEHAELHAATGGEWSKTVDYADGTKSSEKFTFTPEDTGTFEEIRRDGTKITGAFDSAEHDGVGSFEKTTTFPAGSDPASIYEAGTFRLETADSTLHGSYEKEVRFKSGETLRESVQFDEAITNGVKSTTLKIQAQDGSHGILTIEERAGGSHVGGEWTEANGEFYLFTIEYYPDGSARLEFSCWASRDDQRNGEPPVISGIIHFNPDNSGSGNLTDSEGSHTVTINPDGSASVGS